MTAKEVEAPAAPPVRSSELLGLLRMPGVGELFTLDDVPELLAQADLDQVELEFRAQFDAVAHARLTPTHLDRQFVSDGGMYRATARRGPGVSTRSPTYIIGYQKHLT